MHSHYTHPRQSRSVAAQTKAAHRCSFSSSVAASATLSFPSAGTTLA